MIDWESVDNSTLDPELVELLKSRGIGDEDYDEPTGVPPVNVKEFSVWASDGNVKLTLQGPDDTVIQDQKICRVAGILVLRKEGSYPLTELEMNDEGVVAINFPRGDAFTKYTRDNPYIDRCDNDKTYYYTPFPYSDHGVYNRSCDFKGMAHPDNKAKIHVVFTAAEAEGCTITAKKGDKTSTGVVEHNLIAHIEVDETGTWDVGGNRVEVQSLGQDITLTAWYYGYNIELEEPDPELRTTYPEGLDNTNYTPAYMDFTAQTFNYGSWTLQPGEQFMPRPVMLKYDGTVDYELNPNDYTLKKDSEEASDVTNLEYEGNAMMEWGKVFTNRWETDGIYHFRCCNFCCGDDWDCWPNYDKNDRQIDHFYMAIYFGHLDSTVKETPKIRSISINGNYTFRNNAAGMELARSYAKANGEGWDITPVVARFYIQDLVVMLVKNTNTKLKYGYGRTPAGNSPSGINPGLGNQKGMFWGMNNTANVVKVFGIENLWENLWVAHLGMIIKNKICRFKFTVGTHDGSKVVDYQYDDPGYIDLFVHTAIGSSGTWVRRFKSTKFGRIPYETGSGASSTTYEGDVLWLNTSVNNTPYFMASGSDYADATCGVYGMYQSEETAITVCLYYLPTAPEA